MIITPTVATTVEQSPPDPELISAAERSHPLRLCLITETFFPQLNGVSRTLSQLETHLREQGEDVLLVHPDYRLQNLPSHRVQVRSTSVPFYPELRLPVPPFRRVWKRLLEFQPDLIHIATEATLGLAALRFALHRQIPVVSSFHTNFDQYTDHYGLGWSRGLIWRYLRWFHNRTLETYVPSESTRHDLESRGFERLTLWPRGVDSKTFRPDRPGRHRVRAAYGFDEQNLVIGHVGRLAAEKNVDFLADSLTLVLRRKPQARVLIVGDGPARPWLQERLGDRAVFAGFQTGEDLADHYAAADLFGFASRTETFGNVVLEAMATGLPVVAVRSGGPSEIVQNDRTGFLIDPEATCDTHAAAILHLIDDPALRTTMGRAGRTEAESRSWEQVMSRLHTRYRALSSRCVSSA